MIGDDVSVVVVDIRGDKVSLGIEAPRTMPVHRREVYNAIKSAAATKPNGTEKYLFGIKMESRQKDQPPRIAIIESIDGNTAMLRARARVNDFAFPPADTSYHCFGVTGEEARTNAAQWVFESWVSGYDLVRTA